MSNLHFLPTKPQQAAHVDGPPRVAFVTLGCKVNQSDTQKAIADFRSAGFRIVPPHAPAEVYVVNTCSVTHIADRKSRSWLRRTARANPSALVVATGCYAESGREVLGEMDEVGLVIGYRQKDSLLELVLRQRPELVWGSGVWDQGSGAAGDEVSTTQHSTLNTHNSTGTPSWASGDVEETHADGRTRAMVKIEDGCNDFCTFCIIPFTRGMPRSTPTNEVVRAVNRKLAEGYREIVLTGVHMGKYGQDHAQRKRAQTDPAEAPDLPSAVRAVLERTAVPRLRITSVEPTDAIMMLPLLADEQYTGRLVPHLHLPLQSGCDRTLARMKRDYTTEEYANVVRQCREVVPGISITTDLITGFPGETEQDWARTRQFVESMEFAKIHVFPYSSRPGTAAATMDGHVHPDIRHARTLEMIGISRRAEGAYAARHLGQTLSVLWETQTDGIWSGLTGNYLRVHVLTPRDMHNRITPATLLALDAYGLWAEPPFGGGTADDIEPSSVHHPSSVTHHPSSHRRLPDD